MDRFNAFASKVCDFLSGYYLRKIKIVKLICFLILCFFKPDVAKVEFYANGLRSLLKYIKDKYGNPEIMITENG